MEFIFYIVLAVMSPAIIGSIGGMYVHIRDSKQKLEYKKMIEARKLEEIKQENYLLENESMRQELARIRSERKQLESITKDKRWLVEERSWEKDLKDTNTVEKSREKEG